LSIELDRRQPDTQPLLHQRAAAWYAEHGLPDRAVRHAIVAGDMDLAAQVIGEHYLRWLEMGRTTTLLGWLESMPPDVVESDRRLGVVKAWTMHFLGRHEEGNAALVDAIRAPTAAGPLPDGASSIDATAALIGAAFPGDDVGRMLTSARRAFDFEANRDSPWRATVHVLLGFAFVRSGRFEEAREPLLLGVEMASELGLWMDAAGARTLLGRVELETGNPEAAERYARDAIDLADERAWRDPDSPMPRRSGPVLVRRGDPRPAPRARAGAADPGAGEPLSIAESLLALARPQRVLDGGLKIEKARPSRSSIRSTTPVPASWRCAVPGRPAGAAGGRPTRCRSASSRSSGRWPGGRRSARRPTSSSCRTTPSTRTSARSTRSSTPIRSLRRCARELGLMDTDGRSEKSPG
jgi:LuxR family maltose regulon positive regulatory protein